MVALRIFVVGGFLLIGLPLAVVAGCLLTLSGFGTFWGKKYCGRRETRPGHTISENDTEARTRGDEGSA
jgi:membrane protein implicated in regulation of membrane protease activity